MKKVYFLFAMFCIVIFLGGCSGSKEDATSESEFKADAEEVETDMDNMLEDTSNEKLEEQIQSEKVSTKGLFSLEDCKEYDGLYYAFDDDSFNLFSTGGYCLGGKGYIDGMYLANDNMHSTFDGIDKLVLFWESEYTLNLYPVSAQIPVIQLEREDGIGGFGCFTWSNTSVLEAYYRDHVHESIEIQTINGAPPEEYESECIEFTVNPYKGIPSEERYFCLNGFKPNTEVTLGIAEGTTLEEKTYKVDATYYECGRDSNHYEEEDSYYIKTIPTAQGYAELDFSEIPDGEYVMVLWYNGFSNYRATLLELHRS